jgi:hypothetical protein
MTQLAPASAATTQYLPVDPAVVLKFLTAIESDPVLIDVPSYVTGDTVPDPGVVPDRAVIELVVIARNIPGPGRGMRRFDVAL